MSGIYIVTLAHADTVEYDGWYYYARLIVWFTRIPVRVDLPRPTRTAQWFAIKSRVD